MWWSCMPSRTNCLLSQTWSTSSIAWNVGRGIGNISFFTRFCQKTRTETKGEKRQTTAISDLASLCLQSVAARSLLITWQIYNSLAHRSSAEQSNRRRLALSRTHCFCLFELFGISPGPLVTSVLWNTAESYAKLVTRRCALAKEKEWQSKDVCFGRRLLNMYVVNEKHANCM